jgi:hypothetical protein
MQLYMELTYYLLSSGFFQIVSESSHFCSVTCDVTTSKKAVSCSDLAYTRLA